MANITSADVSAIMTVEELFPSGFKLEDFGTDAGIMAESAQMAETRMSLDGKLSAAYTPASRVVNLTFQPNSPSLPYLYTLVNATRTQRRPFEVGLTVRVRATGRTTQFQKGYLRTDPTMPGVGKTLQELTFTFEFESAE